MKRLGMLVAFAFFVGVAVVGVLPAQSHATAQGNEGVVAQAETPEATENAAYEYTAQDGDAYIQMARKAVQTFGIVNNIELNLAQIVFAETQLANDADFPLLNEGEQISFSEDAVKAVAEKAQKLSEEQQAAWASYVPTIDFNTDKIGE